VLGSGGLRGWVVLVWRGGGCLLEVVWGGGRHVVGLGRGGDGIVPDRCRTCLLTSV